MRLVPSPPGIGHIVKDDLLCLCLFRRSQAIQAAVKCVRQWRSRLRLNVFANSSIAGAGRVAARPR
jgi:hypothetical protein